MRNKNSISKYKYEGSDCFEIDNYLCLNCFKFFSVKTSSFFYCCMNCGTRFEAMVIENKKYRIELKSEKLISTWVVESSVKIDRNDKELDWRKVFSLSLTPQKALDLKYKLEAENKERYEKLSEKKQIGFWTLYKINRIKTHRTSWETESYYLSDMKYYKKTGKFLHENPRIKEC